MNVDILSQYKAFDDLPITTITSVATLKGICEPDPAFYIMKTLRRSKYYTDSEILNKDFPKKFTHYDIPITERNTANKRPYIPGTIISMRFSGMKRGLKKKKEKKDFKNSVTIDMAILEKNISLKLSKKKIHLCGASNFNQTIEAVELLLDNIRQANILLKKLHNDVEMTKKVFEWVSDKLKGEQKIKDVHVYIENYVKVSKIFNDRYISDIIKNDEIPINIPEDLDKDLVDLFFRISWDFTTYSDYYERLRKLFKYKDIVVAEPLEIETNDIEMINYNFKLVKQITNSKGEIETKSYKIKRPVIFQLINNYEGFISHYDIKGGYMVTVYLHHQKQNSNKKKNKESTIIIYQRGTITLSSKPKYIRILYYKFMTFVKKYHKIFHSNEEENKSYEYNLKLSPEEISEIEKIKEYRDKELAIFFEGYCDIYRLILTNETIDTSIIQDLTEDDYARIQGYYMTIDNCNKKIETYKSQIIEDLKEEYLSDNKDSEEINEDEKEEMNSESVSMFSDQFEPESIDNSKTTISQKIKNLSTEVIIPEYDDPEEEIDDDYTKTKHYLLGYILGVYYFSSPEYSEEIPEIISMTTTQKEEIIDNNIIYSVPMFSDITPEEWEKTES